MNKVIVGIVIVLAVLIVGGFFYFKPGQDLVNETPGVSRIEGGEEQIVSGRNTQNDTSGAASLADDMIDGVTVNYTDNGFDPKTVTIQKGQMVQFVNMSGRGMWVGSDSHPTHTNYPIKAESDCLGSSFDACTSLPVGESWSFTFGESGTWGYHNHVQAGHRGTVMVR